MNHPLHLLSVTLGSNAMGVNVTVAPTSPGATVSYSVKNPQSSLTGRFQAAQTAHQRGQLAAAQAIYEEILSVQPNHFGALHFLGVVAAQTEQFERAVALIGKSLQIQSNVAAAFNNYGNAFKGLRNYEAALENYDKAIALDGNYADAFFNRAAVLEALNQFETALLSYERAIEMAPHYAEAHLGRGVMLVALNQLDAAIGSYDQAIALRPDHAEAHYFKSLALLKKGDFTNGWVEHEWRWMTERMSSFRASRGFAEPLWLGKENIKGKTILIHGEQGLGDTIQFCRYVEWVAGLEAKVILEVPKPLAQLLGNLQGVSQIVEKGRPLPQLDYYIPLMSLPLAFKTGLTHMPSSTAYLAADEEKVTRWLAKLGPATKPRVGLVWSGSTFYQDDRSRSVGLAELLKHLPGGFQYVSLQKEIRETDREALLQILDCSNDQNDFSDAAALCACMNLIISVDTSVAHLGGALGIPTWIMVAFAPDWRWLLGREDSPWYQSVRIYRQERRGDWIGVMQRIATDLTRRASP